MYVATNLIYSRFYTVPITPTVHPAYIWIMWDAIRRYQQRPRPVHIWVPACLLESTLLLFLITHYTTWDYSYDDTGQARRPQRGWRRWSDRFVQLGFFSFPILCWFQLKTHPKHLACWPKTAYWTKAAISAHKSRTCATNLTLGLKLFFTGFLTRLFEIGTVIIYCAYYKWIVWVERPTSSEILVAKIEKNRAPSLQPQPQTSWSERTSKKVFHKHDVFFPAQLAVRTPLTQKSS